MNKSKWVKRSNSLILALVSFTFIIFATLNHTAEVQLSKPSNPAPVWTKAIAKDFPDCVENKGGQFLPADVVIVTMYNETVRIPFGDTEGMSPHTYYTIGLCR